MSGGLHEDLQRRGGEKTASERSFGFVSAGVFALVALWPLMSSQGIRWWAVGVAAMFLALAYLAPGVLKAPNRLWMAIGKLLHTVISPVVMAALYIVAVVPTGLALRLAGKDPLRLKRDPKAPTYWLTRTPPGPADSFKNQF